MVKRYNVKGDPKADWGAFEDPNGIFVHYRNIPAIQREAFFDGAEWEEIFFVHHNKPSKQGEVEEEARLRYPEGGKSVS